MSSSAKLRVVPLENPRKEQVLELLGRLLKDAKAGKLRSLCVVAETRGGCIVSGFTECDDRFRVGGYLSYYANKRMEG